MTIEKILDDCANTIRQQEAALLAEQKHNEMLMAEIEALKKKLALQKLSDIGQEIEDRESAIYATGYWKGIEYKRMRELTDEEIYALAVENGAWKSKESGNVYPDDLELLNFARTILKKASEK